jgi:hypothetical protein
MDPNPFMDKLFGVDDSGCISSRYISQLLKLAWSGGLPSPGIRALCWRIFLGLISSSDKSMWESEFNANMESYRSMRTKVLPSLDKVSVDPLSQLSDGNSEHSEEWNIYYKNVDLINFIKTDLDRLYISGIPDEHFESPQRRDMLLSILLVWSFQHPVISYRQGMHEVAGYVMYCVEQELKAFNSFREGTNGKPANDEYGLLNVINEANVEAHTYALYARIMKELEPIYDPVAFTPRGAESQPFVVQYSMKIQGTVGRFDQPVFKVLCFVVTLFLVYEFCSNGYRALSADVGLRVVHAPRGMQHLRTDLRPAMVPRAPGSRVHREW